MPNLDYTILGLIGFAIVAIIVALIYSKVIKPVKMSYTSSSFFIKNKIKNIFLSLINKLVINKYKKNIIINDLSINTKAIKQIAIGKNIYLISDPLYYNIINIQKDKNEIVVKLKNKETNYPLPFDVQTFIKGSNELRKKYKKNLNFEIIIPCLNKEINDIKIDNINFININNLENKIIEIENNTNINNDLINLKNFEKTIIYSKKRFFINYKNEYIKK